MISCVVLEAIRILPNYRVVTARNGYTLPWNAGLSLVVSPCFPQRRLSMGLSLDFKPYRNVAGINPLAWLGQAIDVVFVGARSRTTTPGYHAQCFDRCHSLISAASFVRSETLLWSSFARPLMISLVGTTLPLII
jgi:hypothetical protein